MTSILKTDEIQSQNGGSVVKMQTLKHPSASGNNITLDGSNNVSLGGTLSAGTIGDNMTFPTGSVIGFNFASSTNIVSTITLDTWITTGLSVQITPKKNNSKIYIIGTGGLALNNTGHTGFKVIRTGPSSQDLGIQETYNSTGWCSAFAAYASIDTPSSVSACTYTLYMYVDTNSSQAILNYSSRLSPTTMNLMAMEVQQ